MKLVTDSDSSGFASPVVKRDFAERPATPGVIEISELLYHARPAGLVVNTERSAGGGGGAGGGAGGRGGGRGGGWGGG